MLCEKHRVVPSRLTSVATRWMSTWTALARLLENEMPFRVVALLRELAKTDISARPIVALLLKPSTWHEIVLLQLGFFDSLNSLNLETQLRDVPYTVLERLSRLRKHLEVDVKRSGNSPSNAAINGFGSGMTGLVRAISNEFNAGRPRPDIILMFDVARSISLRFPNALKCTDGWTQQTNTATTSTQR